MTGNRGVGMNAEKVRFTEDQSTNLATLYGRLLDSRSARPILGDPTAADAVARIDYDFAKFGVDDSLAASVAARAKVFDTWVSRFLSEAPASTVLHLGCGMDSRAFRLSIPADTRWFDVDFPEVIALRERVYPGRPGYQTIGSSVTDLGWLARIPTDRPVCVLAEGLTMYLDPDEGRALLRAVATTFSSGEVMFDAYSRLGVKAQPTNRIVRRAGARLRWGIDDPRELESLGLRLVERMGAEAFATDEIMSRLSWAWRLSLRLAVAVPALRNMGALLRYRIDPTAGR